MKETNIYNAHMNLFREEEKHFTGISALRPQELIKHHRNVLEKNPFLSAFVKLCPSDLIL